MSSSQHGSSEHGAGSSSAGEAFSEQDYHARLMESSSKVRWGIAALVIIYLLFLATGALPTLHHEEAAAVTAEHAQEETYIPPFLAAIPFVALLGAIAFLPLFPATAHWWHHNRNRFIVAASLGLVTLGFYYWWHPGGIPNHFTHSEGTAPGWQTAAAAFSNGIFAEFVPFIVLLFTLYVISGGINVSGDLAATPATNVTFLGIGAALASFIGTTGAAMVLIRPLLNTNHERRYRKHTVIFFIFTVCNCGGLLLPIGDPPLFLGYLRGVPFTWTLSLWPYWLAVNGLLLIIYFIWDSWAFRKERLRDVVWDAQTVRPLRIRGKINFPLLLLTVLLVAFVVPDQSFLGTSFVTPVFFREILMLLLVALSLWLTEPAIRARNRFDYFAITEVAALFSGIFVCMQVPIEILHVEGASLGLTSPVQFFWATGLLSSFLDNAPTYVVFFETAASLPHSPGELLVMLLGGGAIASSSLVAISLGAVFMGANTYIGNGPNFMVKSIAEQSGVRMPSFFGYMLYSGVTLIPIFIALSWVLR